MTQYAPPPAGMPYPPVPPGPTGMPAGGPPPFQGYGGYSPPPPVRKGGAGKVVGILAGVFVAVVGAIFVVVMAFGAPVVTADQVEEQIAQQYGVAPDQISCPSSLEGEVGAQITCTGTDAGQTTTLLVRVTGVQGDTVNFDIIPQ